MQRNGQNPIRAVRNFETGGSKIDAPSNAPGKLSSIAGICASCKTEVPFKPGFRPSALKCPKCGKPLGKK